MSILERQLFYGNTPAYWDERTRALTVTNAPQPPNGLNRHERRMWLAQRRRDDAVKARAGWVDA